MTQQLAQHPLGLPRVGGVTHACPECDIAYPRPLCPVCLGAGQISTEQLDRYQYRLNLDASEAS
ncbi:MAG TPA: hypothetical protein VFE14_20925 [Micromonosporaceae bacterium]|jgi:hypothetical protein|nr:hypothetical protein [Micromonosporaceae bacterium]